MDLMLNKSIKVQEEYETEQQEGNFGQRSCFRFGQQNKVTGPKQRNSLEAKARLHSFVNISVRDTLLTSSEIGWINKNYLILTLNDDYYIINLKHTDMIKVRNGIKYGMQQVNMNLFCSITRKTSNNVSHDGEETEAKMIQKISN